MDHRAPFSQTISETSPAFFAALDAGGRIQSLNEPLRQALEGKGAEGDDFAELCVPERRRPAFRTALARVAEGGGAEVHVVPLLAAGDDELDVEIHLSGVRDAGGELAYVAWTGFDLGPRNRLETLLAESQRVETIGFLAAGIAHDFNNLLMSIQSNISLMLIDADAAIERQVQAGSDLTRQLLGFAGAGRSRLQRLDLNTLVQETSQTFAAVRRDIQLELDLDARLLRVEADRRQVEQALLSLYVNASSHLPDGGHLLLTTLDMQASADLPWPDALTHEHYALVAVNNTGDGHPPAEARRVAARLSRPEPAVPLGLRAAANLAERYGGFLCFERAQEGRGGTYTIGLPGFETSLSTSFAQPASPTAREEQIRILLVDDEEHILKLSAKVLSHLGFKVYEAKGGREALSVYRANRQDVDLVLLDMAMPDLDGSQVFDKLREIDPDVRVVLMSGYDKDDAARRMLKDGAIGFLQKPFNMREASKRIRKLLGREVEGE